MLPRNPPSARLTGTIDAPKLAMSAMRSALIQSGMKIVTGWPSARPMAANEMPVLPLVASAIVIARPDPAVAIGRAPGCERHPVLDAAGQVERLLLGVDHARLAAPREVDREQRRIADQAMQRAEALSGVGVHTPSVAHPGLDDVLSLTGSRGIEPAGTPGSTSLG